MVALQGWLLAEENAGGEGTVRAVALQAKDMAEAQKSPEALRQMVSQGKVKSIGPLLDTVGTAYLY